MPVHDWTKVEAGIFHHMYVAWVPEISKALNGGLLPDGYYALVEQHAGKAIPDVLTLHGSPPPQKPRSSPPPDTGGIAVAEAPPRVRRQETFDPSPRKSFQLWICEFMSRRCTCSPLAPMI